MIIIDDDGIMHKVLPMDTLDKIRTEIEQRKQKSGGEPNRDLAFNVCLQIVDKYRSEVNHETNR